MPIRCRCGSFYNLNGAHHAPEGDANMLRFAGSEITTQRVVIPGFGPARTMGVVRMAGNRHEEFEELADGQLCRRCHWGTAPVPFGAEAVLLLDD